MDRLAFAALCAAGWTSSPLWIYTLILIGFSVIISFRANLSQFSVITEIAMRAMFKTVSRYLGGLFLNVQPSEAIPFELVMAACGLGAALVLAIVTKAGSPIGNPRHEPRPACFTE